MPEPAPEEWAVAHELARAAWGDLASVRQLRRQEGVTILARRFLEAQAGKLGAGQEDGEDPAVGSNRMFWSRALVQRARLLVGELRRVLPSPEQDPWPGPAFTVEAEEGLISGRSPLLHPEVWSLFQENQERYWDRSDPPFPCWGEARSWLLREAGLEGTADAPLVIESGVRTLHLPASGGSNKLVPGRRVACTSPALLQVWDLTQRLVAGTGWEQGQALAHLLCGALPLMGGVRVRHGTIPRAELMIYPGLTTERDFEYAVKALRQACARKGGKGEAALTDDDIALLEAMREMGPPPDKIGPGRRTGSVGYWRTVGQQVGRSWNACRKRWDRLRERWDGAEEYVGRADAASAGGRTTGGER